MNQGTTEAAAPVVGHPGGGIDLIEFCGKDETRPYLMKPFRYKGFTWATNGHILVRVSDDAQYPKLEVKMNPAGPLKLLDGVTLWGHVEGDLPSLAEPVKCGFCGGSGKDLDSPEIDCGICDGEGSSDPEVKTSVTVDGIPFALNYVRLMLSLPDVEIAPGTASQDIEKRLPLLFRFKGGIGALMALRKPHDTHVELAPRQRTDERRGLRA